MRRNLQFATVVAAAMLVSVAVGTAAAQPPPYSPLEVNFVVPTTFLPGGGSGGPFTATGLAVAVGLVCPSGDTIDTASKASGFQSGQGLNFQVTKQFTCADGSGTFDVLLSVRIDRKGDNFNWRIVGGTNAYADLHGSGQGYGISTSPEGVTDYYFGTLK